LTLVWKSRDFPEGLKQVYSLDPHSNFIDFNQVAAHNLIFCHLSDRFIVLPNLAHNALNIMNKAEEV